MAPEIIALNSDQEYIYANTTEVIDCVKPENPKKQLEIRGNSWKWHFRDPKFQNFLGEHAPRPPWFGAPSALPISTL